MTGDSTFTLPANARPGRVALGVGALERVVLFYRDVVGLCPEREGNRVQFAADSADSPLLELHGSPNAPERTPEEAGLFHVAFLLPDRAALADALKRVRASAFSLTGASDHRVSEALYCRDPAGNGVELYRDRPIEEWPLTDDGVAIDTRPLDLDDLAHAADTPSDDGHGSRSDDPDGASGPDGSNERTGDVLTETTVGHVHLESTALERAEAFYADGLGLRVRSRYGDRAVFVAAGEYHHHLGLNTWNRRTEPAGDGRGLRWFEFVLPADVLDMVCERLEAREHRVDRRDGRAIVTDPDGIEVRLSTPDGRR